MSNFISKINNHALLDSPITIFLDITIEYYFNGRSRPSDKGEGSVIHTLR